MFERRRETEEQKKRTQDIITRQLDTVHQYYTEYLLFYVDFFSPFFLLGRTRIFFLHQSFSLKNEIGSNEVNYCRKRLQR